MNWNDLKLFLAVADKKSLSGGAAELAMSHTTAFRHLTQFEKRIGTRLFERSKGAYELTELGEEMLSLGQGISSAFDDIDRKIIGRDITPKGTVKLTAPASFSYSYLPRFITAFHQDYPDITIELLVSNQAENMNTRTADIALRVSHSPPETLVGRKVASIKWAFYGAAEYLARVGSPLSFSELAIHPLIGATGQLGRHEAYRWLDKSFSDQIVQRTDDLTAMAYFAAEGMGLALLPDDLACPELQRCFTCHKVEDNSLWILTHPDLRKVERVKIVMGYLAKAFATDHDLAVEG